MNPKIVDDILSLARVPETKREEWLSNSVDSVSFMKKNFKSDQILIYASGPHFLAHSVLVDVKAVTPPDIEDLSDAFIMQDDTWCIQRAHGGGEGHRVYLEEPLSHPGCNTLAGGEKLVFLRPFHEVKNHKAQIEISQKLVHALGLHYIDERGAYCRLDSNGDFEDVITVFRDTDTDIWKEVRGVYVNSKELATYMAVTSTALVSKFDFTRFLPAVFNGWGTGKEERFEAPDLFYRHRVNQNHASYVNGFIVLRTTLTTDDLVKEWIEEDNPENKKYASFKIIDRKNNCLVETSCSPKHIVNYFTDSNLPWEISPAFFRPEVLQRYKSDSEKYTFEDRLISCRGSWELRTYDINEAGQVHSYIGYLADLPYEEQLYWQAFNEWPKANISERAYQSDIKGEFSTVEDSLHEIKSKIKELNIQNPVWWNPRDVEIINAVHYPVTDSPSEWGDEILSLDQMIVEGFSVKGLRNIINELGGSYEKEWRSIKLLEVALNMGGSEKEDARNWVAVLRLLNSLRIRAKAHGTPDEKRKLISEARKTHGTLREHFKNLSRSLDVALEKIIASLASD